MYTGLVAEFRTPEEMLHALRDLRQRGYRRLDTFTPYPIHGVEKALGYPRSVINRLVFPIAFLGALIGYLIQWACNACDYPLNVGGRPLNSVLAFIPITFETGVLTASGAGILLFLVLTGLPSLHTPVADVPGFERASIDRFWVGIDDRDPHFDARELEQRLLDLGALSVGHARRRPR